MTADQLASLAMSLRDNEAFQQALTNTRTDALETLVLVNPAEHDQIIGLQATVKVVDNIRGNLEQFIRSGATKKPPGIA